MTGEATTERSISQATGISRVVLAVALLAAALMLWLSAGPSGHAASATATQSLVVTINGGPVTGWDQSPDGCHSGCVTSTSDYLNVVATASAGGESLARRVASLPSDGAGAATLGGRHVLRVPTTAGTLTAQN